MVKKLIFIILVSIQGIIALPLALIFIILGLIFDYINAYSDVSMVISRIPLHIGEIVRYIYYKVTLKKIGKLVKFKYGSAVLYRNVEIGNYVLVGYNTLLGECSIGNDVIIGSYVNITSGTKQHKYDDITKPFRLQKGERKKIKIGNNVWIGNNVVIANDIYENCVIGLNSAVVRKLDKSGVYVGTPAKKIKDLF